MHHIVESRTRPLLERHRGRAEEEEAGDPLLCAHAEAAADLLRIGGPAGYPAAGKAQSVGGEEEVHAGRAARQLLLPDRDLGAVDRARDEDDQLGRLVGEAVDRLQLEPRRLLARLLLGAIGAFEQGMEIAAPLARD